MRGGGGEVGVVDGIDEDVAVAEDEGVGAGEITGEIHDAACAVLDDLGHVFDTGAKALAIAKEAGDDIRAVADNDEKTFDAGGFEALEDVEEDRFAVDLEHGLGEIGGVFAHTGAAAGGEENGFADGCGFDRHRRRMMREGRVQVNGKV